MIREMHSPDDRMTLWVDGEEVANRQYEVPQVWTEMRCAGPHLKKEDALGARTIYEDPHPILV